MNGFSGCIGTIEVIVNAPADGTYRESGAANAHTPCRHVQFPQTVPTQNMLQEMNR